MLYSYCKVYCRWAPGSHGLLGAGPIGPIHNQSMFGWTLSVMADSALGSSLLTAAQHHLTD